MMRLTIFLGFVALVAVVSCDAGDKSSSESHSGSNEDRRSDKPAGRFRRHYDGLDGYGGGFGGGGGYGGQGGHHPHGQGGVVVPLGNSQSYSKSSASASSVSGGGTGVLG